MLTCSVLGAPIVMIMLIVANNEVKMEYYYSILCGNQLRPLNNKSIGIWFTSYRHRVYLSDDHLYRILDPSILFCLPPSLSHVTFVTEPFEFPIRLRTKRKKKNLIGEHNGCTQIISIRSVFVPDSIVKFGEWWTIVIGHTTGNCVYACACVCIFSHLIHHFWPPIQEGGQRLNGNNS